MAENCRFVLIMVMILSLHGLAESFNICGGKNCGDRPCCLNDEYEHVCCADEKVSAFGMWWFWFSFAAVLFILGVCYSVCVRSRRIRQQRYLIIRRQVEVVPATYGTEDAAPVLTSPYLYCPNGQQLPPYSVMPVYEGQPPPYKPSS